MPGDVIIDIDESAIHDQIDDPHGEVQRKLLSRVGEIVKRDARIRAPVLTGRLFDSIAYQVGSDGQGGYVDISAEWYDVFLEKPARQLHRPRRTLRNALHAIPKLL